MVSTENQHTTGIRESRRVDPELGLALAAMPKGPNGLIDVGDIPGTRVALDAMADMMRTMDPPDPTIAIDTFKVAKLEGSMIDVRVFKHATSDAMPVLLWFHGGGQVFCSAADEDGYLSRLCIAVGCAIASVDYRLAPEAPAPAAAEDGYSAYLWLIEQASVLGIDQSRIGIGGASGGGGVAASVALMIRDRGAPTPRLLAFKYPMIDDRNETASSHEITDVGVWDRKNNILAWQAVLGDDVGGDAVTHYQAAARATDLSGLPPTFIAVGELDVFRDENIAFACSLIAQDVPTELHVFAGAFHAWDVFAPTSALSRDFNQIWHSFLKRRFARQ